MIVRVHVFIEGMVQGVSFRWATFTKARSMHVTGWVRNLTDGRVEAIFEGEQKLVEQMVDFCRKGPSGARVTAVRVSQEEYLENLKGFKIRHK